MVTVLSRAMSWNWRDGKLVKMGMLQLVTLQNIGKSGVLKPMAHRSAFHEFKLKLVRLS